MPPPEKMESGRNSRDDPNIAAETLLVLILVLGFVGVVWFMFRL